MDLFIHLFIYLFSFNFLLLLMLYHPKKNDGKLYHCKKRMMQNFPSFFFLGDSFITKQIKKQKPVEERYLTIASHAFWICSIVFYMTTFFHKHELNQLFTNAIELCLEHQISASKSSSFLGFMAVFLVALVISTVILDLTLVKTLKASGLEKLKQGITSFSELQRVLYL